MIEYKIEPGVGMDVLLFGSTDTEITDILGDPAEIEQDDDDDFPSEMWIYPEHQLTLFMEGSEEKLLICIETNHPDTVLFGKKIFGISEKELMDLMSKNNCGEVETEDEAWGERRISFDDCMLDFYFDNGKLSTANFSVVDDEDE